MHKQTEYAIIIPVMKMKVYFVRHGQSQANLDGVFAGQTDAKLTDLGRAQAEAIRPILAGIPFDKVYSSDLSRAYETQSIALPGYEPEKLPQLREIDVGNLAGQSIAAVAAAHGGITPTSRSGDYTPFGGENWPMMDARVGEFLKMLEQQPYENVAVFAHRGVLMSAIRNLLDIDAFHTGTVFCDNCAVNVLEYTGKLWRILALNYGRKI